MRAIDSGIGLARALDLPIRIYWELGKELNCPFDRLFQPLRESRVQLIETKRRPLRFAKIHRTLSSKLQKIGFDNQYYAPSDYEQLRGLDHSRVKRNWPMTIESWSRFYSNPVNFQIFTLAPEISRRIDERIAGFTSRTVGVHIRRTDNAKSIQHSPDALFVQHMQAEIERHSETNFYLATDSQDVKKYFTEVFGRRIITTSFDASRDNIQGIEEATVELYALSKTCKILGSYWSSYSQTAAELGNIELIKLNVDDHR